MRQSRSIILGLILIITSAAGTYWFSNKKNLALRKLLEKEIIKNDSILSVKLLMDKELERNRLFQEESSEKIKIQNLYIDSIEKVLELKEIKPSQKNNYYTKNPAP